LITFFIGLILALQSAYEPSALSLELCRQCRCYFHEQGAGPLITAIIVIGRSGSAFAAELEP
jgi:phospholipid/cholesterol/gamma-HCH transport system permease protein